MNGILLRLSACILLMVAISSAFHSYSYDIIHTFQGSTLLHPVDLTGFPADHKRVFGCPEGFDSVRGSTQCFKLIKGGSTWAKAKQLCLDEGLLLAKPSNKIAVQLRKLLLDKYVFSPAWVDAKGDGFKLVWQRDGTTQPCNHKVMLPGSCDKVATTNCLTMNMWDLTWNQYPEQPYGSNTCTDDRLDALCEAISSPESAISVRLEEDQAWCRNIPYVECDSYFNTQCPNKCQ